MAISGKRDDKIFVTFDANGGLFSATPEGEFSNYSLQIGNDGKIKPLSFGMSYKGHRFKGFSLSPNGMDVIDFETYIFEADTTVYAAWASAPTVTFDASPGFIEGTLDQTKTIVTNDDFIIEEIPDATLDGHILLGWYLVKDGLEFPVQDVIENSPSISFESIVAPIDFVNYHFEVDTTVYAIWDQAVQEVMFDANGGKFIVITEVDGEETISEISTIRMITDEDGFVTQPSEQITRPGFRFLGWGLNPGSTDLIDLSRYAFTTKTTVYAVWEMILTVTFDANKGIFETSNATTVDVEIQNGSVIPPSEPPIRLGYAFGGWASSSNGSIAIDFDSYIFSNSATVYAIWKKELPIITFDPNEGAFASGFDPISIPTDDDGKATTPSDPARYGYDFLGWAAMVDATDENVIDLSTQVFTQNTTLYAVWEKIIYITFDSNGGLFSTGTTISIRAIKGKATPPEYQPSKTGYSFRGYSYTKNSSSADAINFKTETFQDNTTVYAIWKLIVNVIFDANGGIFPSGATTTVMTADDDGWVTSPSEPLRDAYVFKGWGITKNSEDAINFDVYRFEKATTVYAIWDLAYNSTIRFGFYDSLNGDRRYDALDMSSLFDGVILDGMYATINHYMEVEPVAGTGLRVVVRPGRAILNHTWNYNDSNLQLSLGTAHASLSRKDAIVLEVNRNTRTNAIKVISGTASANPQPPQLTGNANIMQYVLAYVRVRPKATSIKVSDISIQIGLTIPFTFGLMKQIPIEEYKKYYDKWFNKFNNLLSELKRTVSQEILDDIYAKLKTKVNKADKATTSTPVTNDTLYLTKKSAIVILRDGLYTTDTILAAINSYGYLNSPQTTLNNKLHCDLFWKY